MFNTKELFTTINLWNDTTQSVNLADGTSIVPILGSGTVQGKTSVGETLTVEKCLYVPKLNYSLLSTRSFARPSGFSTHTEDYTTTTTTPTFTFNTDDDLTCNLIYFYLSPIKIRSNHVTAKTIQTPVNPAENTTLDIPVNHKPNLTDEERKKTQTTSTTTSILQNTS